MPLQKDAVSQECYAKCNLFQLNGIQQDCSAIKENTYFHQAPVNRELKTKASQEPRSSKQTQEVIFQKIILTPEKNETLFREKC
jgi:hypothetical protein